MPKNKSEANDIILLNGDGPSILVDIPNKGKCEIYNFKVTHTAKSESKEASQKQKAKVINAFAGLGKEFLNYDEDDPHGWVYNTTGTDDDLPCLVRVKQGKLIMKVSF